MRPKDLPQTPQRSFVIACPKPSLHSGPEGAFGFS
jgi:hypothetical protein